jgi:hypothetical protein
MGAELEYYKEHTEHGRHIEVQRTAVAGLAVTISGAIIGELLKELPLRRAHLPYTVTLLFVGLVAWLLSAKLYERFRLHTAIAAAARNVLDPSLVLLRDKAEEEHRKKFRRLYNLRLHRIWYLLFGIISVLGLVTTIIIVCQWKPLSCGTWPRWDF